MTDVKFGVGFAPNVAAPSVLETAQLAERLGFDVFWITDSHLAGREAMAMLGALAVSTDRIHLGPGVSHLAGRHPTVIASAMATLDELAPGRIRLGIGVGDSGPLNLGVPRTSLLNLEQAIRDIHALLEGREVAGTSRPLKLAFGAPDKHVPIYVAGSGEKTHRMTGRVADGALISGQPDQLVESIANVRAGELEANKQSPATRIVLWTTVAVDEDREVARTAVRGSVARRALNSFARLARENRLEPDDAEAVRKLQATHDGGHVWEDGYASLVPERWIDTFAIAGTPDEVRHKLERAVDNGADEISMILMGPGSGQRGSADQLTRFAETVLRPMREGVASRR